MRSVNHEYTEKSLRFLIFYSVTMFAVDMVPYVITERSMVKNILHDFSLDLSHLLNTWEAALITTLTNNNIRSKFSTINALIRNQKRASINLIRKVLPKPKPEIPEAFEWQEKTVTMQRIREILDIHYYLLTISKQVNQIFEWPILITMAVNF